jgi:hypothetical protein
VLQALLVAVAMTVARREGAIAGVVAYGDLTVPVIDLPG